MQVSALCIHLHTVEYNQKSLPKTECPVNTVMRQYNQSPYSELFVKCVSNESNTED